MTKTLLSTGIHDRLGDWLDDPVGGPLLRACLLPEGGEASQLDMVRGLTLRRLVEAAGDTFTRAMAEDLVRQVLGIELGDDDFAAPAPAGAQTPALIARHPHLARVAFEDVAIDGPSGPVPARWYRSSGAGTTALVWIHGGGFVGGDLDTPEAHWVSLELAARGIPVLSADYRKVPQGGTYPVPSDDVLAAWRWSLERVVPEGGRLFLGGASAGAALAAALAVRLRDGAGASPAGLVLAYPIVHPTLPPASGEGVDWYVGFTPESVQSMNRAFAGSDEVMADPHAFAGIADVAGMPPTLIVNSENDSLRASGELFAEQLHASAVPVDLELELGTFHGHLSDPASAAAQASIRRIADWIGL